jgi:predicted HicB family RNase H-like nuclease
MRRRLPSQPAYDVRLNLTTTRSLNEAVAAAAAKQLTTMNAWCRAAILEALARDCVALKESNAGFVQERQ